MLNKTIGTTHLRDVGACVTTEPGRSGHAVYGPYERLEAGEYEVEFLLRRAGPATSQTEGGDELCAIVDVASDLGERSSSYDFLFASQLSETFERVVLPFAMTEAAVVEYRVYAVGTVPLEVAELRTVRALPPGTPTAVTAPPGSPDMLVNHRGDVKAICQGGGSIVRIGERVRGQLQGVVFAADRHDDVNFIDELFLKKAYNFVCERPSCVIDVGMNVALASLLFATKPGVREVHAFEPFPETYARAQANLALNPGLAGRITANPYGLGDGDQDATFLVGDTQGDSGGQSTRNVEGGRPVVLSIRDAGETLRPILASARRRGLLTVVKIDCEGAEFDVFRSIERAGLWREVDFLMVEWHRMFEGRDQEELLAPLRAAGLLTVDLSPTSGNGFFYAARMPKVPVRGGPLQRFLAAWRAGVAG